MYAGYYSAVALGTDGDNTITVKTLYLLLNASFMPDCAFKCKFMSIRQSR